MSHHSFNRAAPATIPLKTRPAPGKEPVLWRRKPVVVVRTGQYRNTITLGTSTIVSRIQIALGVTTGSDTW